MNTYPYTRYWILRDRRAKRTLPRILFIPVGDIFTRTAGRILDWLMPL